MDAWGTVCVTEGDAMRPSAHRVPSFKSPIDRSSKKTTPTPDSTGLLGLLLET